MATEDLTQEYLGAVIAELRSAGIQVGESEVYPGEYADIQIKRRSWQDGPFSTFADLWLAYRDFRDGWYLQPYYEEGGIDPGTPTAAFADELTAPQKVAEWVTDLTASKA